MIMQKIMEIMLIKRKKAETAKLPAASGAGEKEK